MISAIVRGIHSVKAIKQDNFNLSSSYHTHVNDSIVVQQLKGIIFQNKYYKSGFTLSWPWKAKRFHKQLL